MTQFRISNLTTITITCKAQFHAADVHIQAMLIFKIIYLPVNEHNFKKCCTLAAAAAHALIHYVS